MSEIYKRIAQSLEIIKAGSIMEIIKPFGSFIMPHLPVIAEFIFILAMLMTFRIHLIANRNIRWGSPTDKKLRDRQPQLALVLTVLWMIGLYKLGDYYTGFPITESFIEFIWKIFSIIIYFFLKLIVLTVEIFELIFGLIFDFVLVIGEWLWMKIKDLAKWVSSNLSDLNDYLLDVLR